jgi:hypothetical protein
LEGDLNTKFFHTIANNRARKNYIFSLEIDGQVIYDQDRIRRFISNHFKTLLGSEINRLVTLDLNLWNENERLTLDSSNSLESIFTIEEIKNVIFEAEGNKSPGPDGLTFTFYQKYWDLIKDELVLIVNAFYNHNLDLSKLNLATIVLIPKKRIVYL